MADEMSKSAKKRAAQKARDAKAAEEAEPSPPPAPEPKAKAKAKAADSAPVNAEPKAKAKAKAEPKAEPKSEPKAKAKAEMKSEPKAKAKAEPKAEPKAEAKGKAKAKAEPKQGEQAEPKAKAEPKAASKSKAKAAPKQNAAALAALAAEEEAKKQKEDVNDFSAFHQFDDGSGDGWEVSAGKSKKQQKRDEKLEDEKQMLLAQQKIGTTGNKHIPGMTLVAGQHIPGMGPAGAGGKAASQSVSATSVQIAALKAELAEAAAAAAGTAAAAGKEPQSSATVSVPEARVGIVIGPKGAKIKLIQEKTGTRIDTSGEVFTITGPKDGVAQAEQAVNDLVSKGYTHLAFEDFAENSVMVYPSSFPDLIGKKGAVVIQLKDKLHVEVSFPDTKTVKPGRKVKVTIAGATKNVEKCKEVINDIIMYGHHEITHEGEVHEELEVEDWAYAAIIGKKGCELRHIQKTFKVNVIIPRETSENTNVVVVGEPDGVKRAKVYIEKSVWNFCNQVKSGRDKDEKATDDWGDEGPEEDWMKQYLYKR